MRRYRMTVLLIKGGDLSREEIFLSRGHLSLLVVVVFVLVLDLDLRLRFNFCFGFDLCL